MLTQRGWWLLAILFGMLLAATGLGASRLSVVAATLLIWFLAGWLRFAWITRDVPRKLSVRREIRVGGPAVRVLWARQTALVHVELHWNGTSTLPYLLGVERVPALAKWRSGEPWIRGPLSATTQLTYEYEVNCVAAGSLVFHGVRVTVGDLQGFFHRPAFVRDRVTVRVLPPFVGRPRHAATKKRHNILPLLGTHRLLRPGSGGDLLDLRDYVPSDPPKLIAWKASAKRDRLITKELESEVPVRCTLIVDASSSTRVGPVGMNALARSVEVAAAVLYANTEKRDLTGLGLIDENGIGRVIRPARGRRNFFEMLHLLADVADLPPANDQPDLGRLLPLGLGLAQDLYPDWLGREANGTPLTAPSFWFNANRRRKKIAAILSHVYDLGPGGIMLLYHDDRLCHHYLDRWLNDHRITHPILLYDEAGRYRFRSPAKIEHLAKVLLAGVSRGKDNELFVLLADLIDLETDLSPLLRAAKVALARHHQVQIVCPWPTGVPLPDDHPPSPIVQIDDLQAILNKAWIGRLHPSYREIRKAFGGLGVTVIPAPSEQTVPRILESLRRLRTAGRR